MPATSFLELLRPLINFDDGLSWWQRGRRIKNKPDDRLEVYISHKEEQEMREIDFKGFGKWSKFDAI